MLPIRVDFYLINDTQPGRFEQVVCRLLDKAYQAGHQVFVCCATREEAHSLNEQLWTYKPECFIPHALVWDALEPPPRIILGDEHQPGPHDLILNLSTTRPPISPLVRRIMELVPPDPVKRALSRDTYRAYRAEGFDLHLHPLH
jgi:DNA polymerase-3 subunit chi